MVIEIKYYVHTSTKDNDNGIATGWLPGIISKKGWDELKELKSITDKEHFDMVISSDLTRAIDTATYLFAGKGEHSVFYDKRLRECNYGTFNGKPNDMFKSRMTEYINTPFPEGESYVDVQKRMADFLQTLKKKHSVKRVALIGHQGPQLALDVLLKNKTWEQAMAEDWRKTKKWQPGWDYKLI